MEVKDEKEITPSQYFDYIKEAKNTITTDALKNSFEIFIKLAEKYNKLGQKESLKKLCFLADTLKKEEQLIEMGITTYVYKSVVEDYIEHVADKTVKIVELSRYMREIPDELVETVEKTKPLFDEFYVLFTDYTGKEERTVEKERRDKDPILFGVFKNQSNVADRFYFLGDWVDEFCDLTLDKMIETYSAYTKEKNGEAVDPTVTTIIPQSSDELIAILKSYHIEEDKISHIKLSVASGEAFDTTLPYYKKTEPIDKTNGGFFDKVRSIFKKQ